MALDVWKFCKNYVGHTFQKGLQSGFNEKSLLFLYGLLGLLMSCQSNGSQNPQSVPDDDTTDLHHISHVILILALPADLT